MYRLVVIFWVDGASVHPLICQEAGITIPKSDLYALLVTPKWSNDFYIYKKLHFLFGTVNYLVYLYKHK